MFSFLLIAKHFDRDPYTNEMLWFSAPPVNAPRAPTARHSLTYLHFLAMKRKQRHEEEGKRQEGDGANGVQNGDEKGDVDLISNSKRMKTQEVQVKPTVRESAQKLWVEMAMDVQ
jgi:chromatin structure-remodeling complex subunit RSC1/2